MISYLEELETATIAEITGLSAANVGMKIHRIKNILSSRFGGRSAMSRSKQIEDRRHLEGASRRRELP